MKEWKTERKRILEGLCIAVSMYSRLPAPTVEWTKEGLSCVLCFFPLIGVFIGAAELGWWYLAGYLACTDFLKGAVGALIPVWITGGIHMDGYMDTSDALNSYGSREKKLEILKDSHLGAFAVIRFGGYLLLYAALYAELEQEREIFLTVLSYVASRAFSAIGFAILEPAKKSGMLYEFASAANKRAVFISNSIVLLWLTLAGWYITPAGILLTVLSGFVFLYYKKIAYGQFGGITGDLAGYFLQLSELAQLGGVVLIKYVL